MTDEEIRFVRHQDKLLKERYFTKINQEKGNFPTSNTALKSIISGWLNLIIKNIKRWLGY